MKKNLFLISFILFFSCNQDKDQNKDSQIIGVELKDLRTVLDSGAGPIESTEFFKASGLKDSVYETESGIVMVVPKGAFLDEKGNTVENEIIIELAEVKSIDDFIRAKLSEISDTLANESERMIYFNATSNGEKLSINENSPVYLEFPTSSNKADLKVFQGIRDKNGNMQWLNGKSSENFLVPIDQSLFDYYPKNFEIAVAKILPFNGHNQISKQLVDSLFFSLSTYYTGKIPVSLTKIRQDLFQGRDTLITETASGCCINTASIQVIQDKKFAKTFLSTREFEYRLKEIYHTGKQAILDYYINNVGKNLYECDQFAVSQVQNEELKSRFQKFANQKLTNTINSDIYTKNLSLYYNNKLKNVNGQLNKLRQKYIDSYKSLCIEYDKKDNEYINLLEKRLKYRMNKFGYTLKSNGGWSNINNNKPQDLPKFELNIEIKNGSGMDRVYVYFEQPDIQSIYAFDSDDKIHFFESKGVDHIFITSLGVDANIYGIGYKGNQAFFFKFPFIVKKINNVSLILKETTQEFIDKELRKNQCKYKRFNKISVDLEYQAYFYSAGKKLNKYYDNETVMTKLRWYVEPCILDSIAY